MVSLAFDLDGTLYDTFSFSIRAENLLLQRYGYQTLSAEELKEAFQSKNFRRYYRKLGVAEEQLETMIREFYPLFNSLGLPELIPQARELLIVAENLVGTENLYVVTNATPENFQARFQRDGLERYLPKVRNTLQGKAELLLEIASSIQKDDGDENKGSKLIYIGDLVCDGEECLAAREKGANNLYFYGLTHQYAYSPRKAMERFVHEHQDFSRAVSSLEELGTILKCSFG